MKSLNILFLFNLIFLFLYLSNSVAYSQSKKKGSRESPSIKIFNGYPDEVNDKLKYCVSLEQKDGKYGWVNTLGEWIISPEYDWIGDHDGEIQNWSEGLIVAKKGRRYGVINYMNEIVIPFKYLSKPGRCNSGVLIVKNNELEYAYFDKTGKQLCPFQKEMLSEFEDGISVHFTVDLDQYSREQSCFVLNTKMDTILKLNNVPYGIDIENIKNGFAPFFIFPFHGGWADMGLKMGFLGYINRKGDMVIEPKISSMNIAGDPSFYGSGWWDKNFYQGRALIWEGEDDFYYIDTLGNKAIVLDTALKMLVAYPFDAVKYSTYHYNDGDFENLNLTEYVKVIDVDGKTLFNGTVKTERFGLKQIIYSNYLKSGYLPHYNEETKVMRILNSEYKETFRMTYEDAEFLYEITSLTNWDSKRFTPIMTISRISKLNDLEEFKVVALNGREISGWISSKDIEADIECGIYFKKNGQGVKMFSFEDKLIYECDSCSIDKMMGEFYPELHAGIYQVKFSNGKSFALNCKGINLNAVCTDFHGGFVDLTDQIYKYNENETVYFNFDQKYLDTLYQKLKDRIYEEE